MGKHYYFLKSLNHKDHFYLCFELTVSNVKSCYMFIDSSQRLKEFENCQHIGLTIASSPLNYSNSNNYLGIKIDSSLSWNLGIINVCTIFALQQLSHSMSPRSLLTLHEKLTLSTFKFSLKTFFKHLYTPLRLPLSIS